MNRLMILMVGLSLLFASPPAGAGDTFYACAAENGRVIPGTIRINEEPVCYGSRIVVSWESSGVDTPAPVPQTAQTECWDDFGTAIQCTDTGQDGDLRKGVKWPVPRFIDNADGTVKDTLTGLTWLKDAGCLGEQNWSDALAVANTLMDGSCGLSDGSVPGVWRLPNVKELLSLIDYSNTEPALPSEHPFINVLAKRYWSSTSWASSPPRAWWVILWSGMSDGTNADSDKSRSVVYAAWAVKGGQ